MRGPPRKGSSPVIVHLKWESPEHDVFIKSPCLCFSMRKLGALGSVPCAHSSVPKGSASLKRASASCDCAQGQPPFPWCSCSSPCPRGDGGPGLPQRGTDTETESVRQRESETEKERHLLLISMGKFPWSRRLGWSPPDRAHRLLGGSPFVSRLPQASLALIQRNPFKWSGPLF